jgi:hypothetical protein
MIHTEKTTAMSLHTTQTDFLETTSHKNMDTAYKREFKFLDICITENRKMEYLSIIN